MAAETINTPILKMLGIKYPVLLAGMNGVAGEPRSRCPQRATQNLCCPTTSTGARAAGEGAGATAAVVSRLHGTWSSGVCVCVCVCVASLPRYRHLPQPRLHY